jgi:hypothetical protein
VTIHNSESLANLAPALALAQGELEDATKSSINPAFKSKYADLAEVLQTIRPVLSKNGLSVVQTIGMLMEPHDGKDKYSIQVATMLLHKSGEWIRDTCVMPLSKVDAQGVGAATTYARRYGLAAIVGIAQDDDDGNAASGRQKAPAAAPKASPKTEPGKTGESLEAAFKNAQSPDELDALAKDFAALSAEDQAKILPVAKAARARVGGPK